MVDLLAQLLEGVSHAPVAVAPFMEVVDAFDRGFDLQVFVRN